MPLTNDTLAEQIQLLASATGIDVQTPEQKEAAEKDAAEAQAQLEKEQGKEAKALEAEAAAETAETQPPAKAAK